MHVCSLRSRGLPGLGLCRLMRDIRCRGAHSALLDEQGGRLWGWWRGKRGEGGGGGGGAEKEDREGEREAEEYWKFSPTHNPPPPLPSPGPPPAGPCPQLPNHSLQQAEEGEAEGYWEG